MTERDYFLRANPDIYYMMQNDTSLKNIATIQELRSLNLDYMRLPQLFLNTDIQYDMQSFDVTNYMKVLLCMVVNNRLTYTLHYKNCYCYPQDVEGLMEVAQKAFEICHSRFIEYFSGILGVQLQSQMGLRNNVVEELHVTITLTEHYRGALSDTFRFLRMCDYVKSELIRYNKIRRGMTQYEIAKVLYNWVVLHNKYDHTFKKYSFTGYSAMAYGYSVCQGFTALYNALCKCFGISIVGMSGDGLNKLMGKWENHIWSFALLDNRNVYIDVTWGCPQFKDDSGLRKYGINSEYLCDFKCFDISYRDLMKEHRWDKNIYG